MPTAKPKCDLGDLNGPDGNVFCIIGKVIRLLNRLGETNKAKEFTTRAMEQKSYEDVMTLLEEYVDVE